MKIRNKISMYVVAGGIGVVAAAWAPSSSAMFSMQIYTMSSTITTCPSCDTMKVGLNCIYPAINCDTGGGSGFTIDGRHYDAKYYPGVHQ